ncbi:hypothetical protein PV327_010248 [Microctonus hyperodae]|uniref:S1 motif domain-containing protein n=1 Tax=Microctonus hyperodae TaxID=165561 RepID=A0AA39FS44_MICHY|nr:hypothetical protein PV327_010248 [Microctonus hyperodae]
MKILRGFLSKKDIDNNIQYYPGQQIFCAVKSVKSVENVTTIKLSTKLKHTTSVTECNQSLDSISPGTLMTLNIKKILSNGLQVVFNKDNVGYLNQIYLNKPLSSYEEGESIVGKLLYVMPTVKLSYFSELLADKMTIKQIKIGEIIDKAKFLFRDSNGIILHLMKGVRGFISFKRTNVDFDSIPSKFIPNSVHKCRVIGYDIFDQIYICSMDRQMLKEKFIVVDNLKAGDKMTVQVTRINNDNGFMFIKSHNIVGDVPPEHIIDINSESDEKPKIGDKIMARVLGKNKQGNGLLFTLKKSLVESDLPILTDINDAKVDKIDKENNKLMLSIVNDMTKSQDEIKFKIGEAVEGTVVESKLKELSSQSYYESKPISSINLGKRVSGIVDKVTEHGLVLKLDNDITGTGTLVALPSRRHVNDLEPKLTTYTIGKKIRCYVVLNKNESELLPICLVKSAFELKKKISSEETKNIKRKIDIPDNDNDLLIKRLKKNAKIVKTKEVVVSKKIEEPKKVLEVNKNTNRKRKIKEEGELDIDEDKSEVNVHVESEKVKEITANLGISECGFYWDAKPDAESVVKEESSSDSDEDEKDDSQQAQKKKKKLNAAERREMERQKEREIRAREEELVSDQIPNSVDQFDRLVLANPDSSIIWLQYMAYHLQATEIDKARAVAKRAIKAINYREENEKLNIWRAWLNLESRFGTPETLNDIFHQAINANDAKNIYLHMLTVHADAGRHVELEKTIKAITGKFKQLPEMWIEIGSTLLKVGLKDKSRHIMQRAIQSLPPQEHVNLMVRFAQCENKYGDKERAQTLFEKILSSYPKRLDVWANYIDGLAKCGDIDGARQVLNKAVVQSLPPKKMRVLFKKYIAFEEKHGTPEGVEHARELAVAYVEKQCNNETN